MIEGSKDKGRSRKQTKQHTIMFTNTDSTRTKTSSSSGSSSKMKDVLKIIQQVTAQENEVLYSDKLRMS